MASFTLNKLLSEVRETQLNFSVKETPFSLQISIRKTPIKYHQAEQVQVGFIPSEVENPIQNEQQQEETRKEMEIKISSLLAQIEGVQQEKSNIKIDLDQMKIDRDISDKCKLALQNSFDRVSKTLHEKDSEILLLKKAIKTLNEEKVNVKSELSKVNKIVKEKEKEIYRLEKKADNLASNAKNYKTELNKIKKEKTTLEKELRAKNKPSKNFIDKNCNFSTSSLSSNMMPLVNTFVAATSSQSTLSPPQLPTTLPYPIMPLENQTKAILSPNQQTHVSFPKQHHISYYPLYYGMVVQKA